MNLDNPPKENIFVSFVYKIVDTKGTILLKSMREPNVVVDTRGIVILMKLQEKYVLKIYK